MLLKVHVDRPIATQRLADLGFQTRWTTCHPTNRVKTMKIVVNETHETHEAHETHETTGNYHVQQHHCMMTKPEQYSYSTAILVTQVLSNHTVIKPHSKCSLSRGNDDTQVTGLIFALLQ